MSQQGVEQKAKPMTIMDVKIPSDADRALAEETARRLAAHIRTGENMKLRLVEDDETLELPAAAARLMLDTLAQMALGNAVAIMPVHAELTTQEAADLLNVSRPYVVQLLEDGKIPHHKVGTHRRVNFEDVIAYKRDIDAKRRKALEELAALDQELGLQ